MRYTVEAIEEDLEFGCEERSPDDPVKAVVHLVSEEGEEKTIKVEDALLYRRDIREGDKVLLNEKQQLEKIEDEQTGAGKMKSTLIKDTTKEERIALIKAWIPDDDGLEDCGIDLWEMYDPYIRGEKEIAECNAAFHTEYFTDDPGQAAPSKQNCGMGQRGFGFR